jgi:DNA topoisomerase-1
MKTTGVLCPKDAGDIVERKSRRGKAFYGCANYPDCGALFLLEKITKKAGRQLVCSKDDCAFVKEAPLEAEPVPA